jgi:hypothetical protein
MSPYAFSTRQPWAWAIVHAGKDIENRAAAQRFAPAVGQRVAVHASSFVPKAAYADAMAFMAGLGVDCPPLEELELGGVIGSVIVRAIVSASASPWFEGLGGLALSDPEPLPFRAAKGNAGLFRLEGQNPIAT